MMAPKMQSSKTAQALGLLSLCAKIASADTRNYDWTLTYSQVPNSNSSKEMILINQSWPPESIEVNQNDTIVVNVKNDASNGIDEGISLHAHGFYQKNNNQNDGPVGVTQCPVAKGGQQQYTWNADQAGTFWVHSHRPGQYPWGLRSPLIVRSPDEPAFYGYDENSDFVFQVADTYNRSFAEVEKQYNNGTCCIEGQSNQCGLEVPPDSAMVHDDMSGNYTYDATQTGSKKMRVRLINMSAVSPFIIFSNDPDIDMTVIEVDGVPLKNTKNAVAKSVSIMPGQRYSVVMNSTRSFLLHAVVDPADFKGNTCQSLLTYKSGRSSFNSQTTKYQYALMATGIFNMGGQIPTPYFAANSYCNETSTPCYTRDSQGNQKLENLPSHASDTSNRLSDFWYTNGKLAPATDVKKISSSSSSVSIEIDMTAKTGKIELADLNSKQFSPPQTPILFKQTEAAINGTNTANAPANGASVDSQYGSNNTYYVNSGTNVIMTIVSKNGPHPFHLHGHDFQGEIHKHGLRMGIELTNSVVLYIQANSSDTYNANASPTLPLRRDTIRIPPQSTAVVAFTANNPGSWFFHCHIDFHSMSGMAGTLITNAKDTNGWNNTAVHKAVADQCNIKS